MRSYTAQQTSLSRRASEALHLFRAHNKNLSRQVSRLVASLEVVEKEIEARLGEPLRDKRVMEIGPGQKLKEAIYFARRNRLTAIDLDYIATEYSLGDYVRMWSRNGSVRTLKTVARRALGVDTRFYGELLRQLGLDALPPIQLINTDASQVDLPDGAFDCITSFSAFEHFEHPEPILREAARLLAPGGVAYVTVHLYTSDSGIHDPRIFSGRREEVPSWAHLRPQHKHKTRPNVYLNEIRLDRWRELFQREWPGVEFLYETETQRADEVAALREAGELAEYSDEELLTVVLAAAWRKPAA